MAKVRTVHRCTECGTGTPKWAGRCPGCGAWNTLVEEVDDPADAVLAGAGLPAGDVPLPIGSVEAGEWQPRSTGIAELDRVLSGGLVPGSVTLVGGEPGVGKSTLLLQVLAATAAAGARCLLISGEESKQQVRLRAERLGAIHPDLWLVAETQLPHALRAIDEVEPDLVVVDSVQTLATPELGSAPGSVAQVRECAARLVQLAKQRSISVVLVGHVTKEGALAGPRVLEHVVDTVLSFEGDRHHALRLLRAVKHRFGSTAELGLFEMSDTGMREVPDPSALFLGDRRPGLPGSAVLPAMEGQRPLLVEVQALVTKSANAAMARRSVQGLDANRVALLLAVLDQRCGIAVAGADVYASAVGGVRIVEPGADLALALALSSAVTGAPVAGDLVACGEVGLGGEIRQVAHTGRRLAEAYRLGFRQAIVPASAPEPPAGMTAVRVRTITDAVRHAGLR